MEKVLNQILAELKFIKDNQTKMESRISELELQLTDKHSLTTKHPHKVKQSTKPGFKPYFDINAMMDYCNSTGIHPADLTSEEMQQFRLRERTIRTINPDERS